MSVGHDKPQYPGPIEIWTEPQVSLPDYVEWVRSKIIEYKIDIFIPTRHRITLAAADLPCKVILPAAPKTLELLDDKFAFAEAIIDDPAYLKTTAISTSDALTNAIVTFKQTHGEAARPCVKPRKGVYGLGFWKLTGAGTSPTSHLNNPDAREIRDDVYLHALRTRECEKPIEELVLMDYLPGPEISFDVLAHEGKLLRAIARTKLSNGQQLIQSHHPLMGDAARLVSRFNLHGVINVQFRRARDDSWKVLEINARPAGGVVYAEDFGTRILADWAGLLSGRLNPADIDPGNIDILIESKTVISQVS